MNVMPVSNPYAPRPPQNSPEHLRDVARRRWMAQQDQQRKRKRRQLADNAIDRVTQIRRLRPGRAAANSLSPVYNMFNESFFRAR